MVPAFTGDSALHEGVGEDNELSHDGRDGDLGRLSGIEHRRVLPSEGGIGADGGQRRHVRIRRALSLPPWMKLRPLQVPDSRLTGASPARLAAWEPVMVPSSGRWTIRPAAVTLEKPGIEVRISDRRWRVSSLRRSFAISASMRFSWRSICPRCSLLTLVARATV